MSKRPAPPSPPPKPEPTGTEGMPTPAERSTWEKLWMKFQEERSYPPLLCAIGIHLYRQIGAGEKSIHRYLECRRCCYRIVRLATIGYQPVRAGWLAGGPWDDPPSEPPTTIRSSSILPPPGIKPPRRDRERVDRYVV